MQVENLFIFVSKGAGRASVNESITTYSLVFSSGTFEHISMNLEIGIKFCVFDTPVLDFLGHISAFCKF